MHVLFNMAIYFLFLLKKPTYVNFQKLSETFRNFERTFTIGGIFFYEVQKSRVGLKSFLALSPLQKHVSTRLPLRQGSQRENKRTTGNDFRRGISSDAPKFLAPPKRQFVEKQKLTSQIKKHPNFFIGVEK